MSDMDAGQIMTLQEVAAYLGLHHLTIYKLVQAKKIPAAKVGGSWRFRRDVLDQWIEKDMEQRHLQGGNGKKDEQ
jgi:excisionase family DNA binding protein